MTYDPMQEALERANVALTVKRREQAERIGAFQRAMAAAQLAHQAAQDEALAALGHLLVSRPVDRTDALWLRGACAMAALTEARANIDRLEAVRAFVPSGADE